MNLRHRRQGRRSRGRDGGFVLVWAALTCTVLLGMAAFAIDVASWNLNANRQQRAADAAALAGVVFLPDGQSTAQSTALTTAQADGYVSGEVAVAPVPGRLTQLQVTVTRTVPAVFGGVFGMNGVTIRRTAVAEYEGPVPIGSPSNGFGNQPRVQCVASDFPGGATDPDYQACLTKQEASWVAASAAGQFWTHVSGPQRPKSQGDAFQSMVCATSDAGCPTLNHNSDYRSEGYLYTLRVPSTTRGRLSVQAFDPAMVDVGNLCDRNLTGASTIPASRVPDARYRYAAGVGAFCTGDEANGASTTNVTTYRLLRPDATPWTMSDNVIQPGCTLQFSGFLGALSARLDPANASYTTKLADGRTVAQVFRQWVDLCTVNIASASDTGDWILQIRTNAPLGQPSAVDTNVGSDGNRFALRAAITSGSGPTMTGTAAGMQIFASGRLGIYANASGADTRFYLAKVLPDAKGRRLALQFYDTGDAAQAGTLIIRPPAETYGTNGTFSGCIYSGPNAAAQTQVSSACTVTNLQSSAGYNGQWMTLSVPIPDDYHCDSSSADGCWIKVQFAYPTGTSVTDTTSWQANIEGDPVRLVG